MKLPWERGDGRAGRGTDDNELEIELLVEEFEEWEGKRGDGADPVDEDDELRWCGARSCGGAGEPVVEQVGEPLGELDPEADDTFRGRELLLRDGEL